MSSKSTRRQFLRSGLLLGAGLGMQRAGVYTLTDPTPTPSETPVPDGLKLTGAVYGIHDPSIIKGSDGVYYVFCTGNSITVRKSADLVTWTFPSQTSVFGSIPEWAREAVKGATNMWAPDVTYHNGQYYLYYSVSTFGSNRSVIGLATNTVLDSKAEGYEWQDQGLVIESTDENDYNCIDPNFVLDGEGNPWLAFGSFWTGLKMRRLDPETGKLSTEDTSLYSLARRPDPPDAIEAPYIYHKGDYYYLFASYDFCCRGANSTYHVRVGRSDTLYGPYVDRDGVKMLEGGGTQITFPTERWKGPGSCGILQEGDTDYLVYHAYNTHAGDNPTLRINPLVWDEDGWPSITSPA